MIRFFEPTGSWLDWLAAHAAGRVVFDVGCGDGHVLRALHKRGVRAIGIDPRYAHTRTPLDLVNCVLPFEAQHCDFLKRAEGTLVLFCRPCHSGFVAETIERLPASAEVLYISKPCNPHEDLGMYGFGYDEIAAPPCPEERVYRVKRSVS